MIEAGKKYVMNTYNRFPLVLERGEGVYVYDDKGKKYLDFVAGIAVNSLGHSNKDLVQAISNQAENLIHVSNLYWTAPQVTLAKKLIENSCFDSVFFCNSGAEAIETAIKLSRKYGSAKGKTEIITMVNSFHGRTCGAVSLTAQPKYQAGFAPLLPDIKEAIFNDFASLEAVITDKTTAIFIEPIQGEGGIIPVDKQYLQKVRKLCYELDILLIFDEIQCGVGRTGYLFAYEYFDVLPDAVALAKGIAGGVPCGALLVNAKTSHTLGHGEHGSTFGGNPLATAAANVVVDYLLNRGLLANVKEQGLYLHSKLESLSIKYDIIQAVRGVGLMQGLVFSLPVAPIIALAMERSLLLVGAGPNIIRFVPPLIVDSANIDECVTILDDVLAEYLKGKG